MEKSVSDSQTHVAAELQLPAGESDPIESALAELFARRERVKVQAVEARERVVASEVEIERLSRAMAALVDLLPPPRKAVFLQNSDLRHAGPHPGRGSAVFGNIVELFKKPERPEWTAPEVQAALATKGIQAESKQIHNILGYLAREGQLKRVDRGRYLIVGYGIGIETSDSIQDGDDRE
ncbi:MAG: hypothetical protein JF625_20310 [Inquilinus limosus]|uniref:Uncharacterized protein n=1 Tax=Inquilinus limosus TaxID=171674 RepID=A0A952FQJ4_9PROT|nr:hypothetical protein [Inquilinus limosus]